MRSVNAVKNMVLKRGLQKFFCWRGVWRVYMGIGIVTKKEEGWRKKGGYDSQGNQALFWPCYTVVVPLLVKLLNKNFTYLIH